MRSETTANKGVKLNATKLDQENVQIHQIFPQIRNNRQMLQDVNKYGDVFYKLNVPMSIRSN